MVCRNEGWAKDIADGKQPLYCTPSPGFVFYTETGSVSLTKLSLLAFNSVCRPGRPWVCGSPTRVSRWWWHGNLTPHSPPLPWEPSQLKRNRLKPEQTVMWEHSNSLFFLRSPGHACSSTPVIQKWVPQPLNFSVQKSLNLGANPATPASLQLDAWVRMEVGQSGSREHVSLGWLS